VPKLDSQRGFRLTRGDGTSNLHQNHGSSWTSLLARLPVRRLDWKVLYCAVATAKSRV